MKKIITILFAVCAFTLAYAEPKNVPVKYERKEGNKNLGGNKSPMRLPVDLFYDSDTRVLSVETDGSLEGAVYVFDWSGNLADSSDSLNCSFILGGKGVYIVRLTGAHWTGSATIAVD